MTLLVGFILAGFLSTKAASPTPATSCLPPARRPVALRASIEEGRNSSSQTRTAGSVLVLDVGQQRVIAEYPVAKGLGGSCPPSRGGTWLAIDPVENVFLVLEENKDALPGRRPPSGSARPGEALSSQPMDSDVCGLPTGAGLDLVLKGSAFRPGARSARHLVLAPFDRASVQSARNAPGFRDEAILLVADAFGGQLAIIDVSSGEVRSTHTLPAHNIRGLALTPDSDAVLLAHQELQSGRSCHPG